MNDSTQVPIPRAPGIRRRELLQAGAVGAVGLLAAGKKLGLK